jgi:hypothetical protein
MTDAALTPFVMVGDPAAEACDGDVCVIPAHPEHGIINRRLDDDNI